MTAAETPIRKDIENRGLVGPRLTLAIVDATVIGEAYFVFPGTSLTVCVLSLLNGFCVVGESMAASPENFDAEIGRRIARESARNKGKALDGYLLRDKLAEGG